ncbi:ABC transporter permease [Pontibacter akesuensis]|uniref:Peptide/nickel transport system permease protein n=1 Tax=Pontibacter akesuensis TaxID=388950 RepID=A0A1I7GEF7_9BACT|nr:ABC transporter permease [Pontibacter akesuensis]GHA57206.1 hypothetical protein GCM10007389_06130 [Pontibacter akesuensis]SFU46867.1 peptide/nickel transport system permease protein [Pontibacter akesuensis]
MLLSLIRKLLLILPALWLLGTIVFLLSRLLPGSFGAERFLQKEAGYYSTGTEQSRQAAYAQFQEKSGLDLPLFYFSLSSTSLPDSLQRVFPEARRQQLEKLTFVYSDWTAVAAYDTAVQRLLLGAPTNTAPYIQTLRYSTDPEKLRVAAQRLTQSTDQALAKAAVGVEQKLQQLEQNGLKHAFLLPHISWHGTDNQYHKWLTILLAGDLGTSYRTGRPVMEMVEEAIGNTLWLLLCSMALTLILAVELSVQMAKGRMQWLRRFTLPSLFLLDSIPLFVLALLLLLLFANPNFLQLFPMYGMGYFTPQTLSLGQQVAQWFQFMALPIICLVLANLPYMANQCYTLLQASMQQDYTRTARAKGLPEQQIIRKHAFRNALIPLITIVSDFLPALVDGAFIIETIFAIPGVGRLLVESVLARDYPVLLAIVLVILFVRMVAYALADIGYVLADPRIKQQVA